VNRRRFIAGAGLAAVGSALASSVMGCSDVVYTFIPCLGPALTPTPVPGMTYIRASEIGCALNCSLYDGSNKHGSGLATDDGPRINAAIAGATVENPITLIIDGSALISGLFLPAGGGWAIAGLGCGTGFFVAKGTNNDGIHNGPADAAIPFDPGPPAPARGKNVSLSNFTLNGNQGNGKDGNSTSGNWFGNNLALFCGINLMNLDNIDIENVVVVNTPAFHFRLSNVGNVKISGCVMKSQKIFTDGLHFDGPANDITISNCNFTTGDDSIALNACEGHSGNISRVTVTNCQFNSWSLMRLYTTSGGPIKDYIDTVSVSNCTGTLSESAFIIGLYGGSNLNSVTGLTISDCTVTAPDLLGMAENFGTISVKNVTLIPSKANISWFLPQVTHSCGLVRPAPTCGTATYTGSTLYIENCIIARNEDMNLAAVILDNNSSITNLVLNGIAVQDTGTFSPLSALFNIGQGSVDNLVIDSVNPKQIETLIAPGNFSTIGSVAGSGVLATGWKFPDAVMANGVPYISANSGLPSIKINGVVEPYSGA